MARELKCPKCKSTDVQLQMTETGSITKKTGVGLAGNTYNAVRGVASVVTLGVAGKILPKATGKEKTKNKLVKMAMCRHCGHSWKIN